MKNIIYTKRIVIASHPLAVIASVAKQSLLALLAMTFTASCSDFLDVVPDNVPTIEHAFKNRAEAENYLVGLFYYMPNVAHPSNNPELFGCDETWWSTRQTGVNLYAWRIASGEQNTNDPYMNFFEGRLGGGALYRGLRDCNIFIENVGMAFDLDEYDRNRYIAEVKFLKAYFHFWLFRQYGPIPLIDKNLDISEDASVVMVYREPVDDCVEFIINLLDEAYENLPTDCYDIMYDEGRPTQLIVKAFQAVVLTYAASPLFNCNTDLANYKDNQGRQLFPQDESQKQAKWERARDSIKVAIDMAHENRYSLYDFRTSAWMSNYASSLSEETINAAQMRGAATERGSSELIWGDTGHETNSLQNLAYIYFTTSNTNGGYSQTYSPTLKIVEQYYTKNGIPIEDDPSWEGVDPYVMKPGDEAHKQYIRQTNPTLALHFNREPRFYGSISFEGGTWYGNGKPTVDNTSAPGNMYIAALNFVLGISERASCTGYGNKKMCNLLTTAPETSSTLSHQRYSFPLIRLSDLYLLYSEALNETLSQPNAEVYEYIDLVRARYGLKGVVDSWKDHAYPDKQNKPLTKDGFRQIVQRERLIELAFEGHRYWDIRRWKLLKEYMNQPVRGLNAIPGVTLEEFNKVVELANPQFTDKDYFTPIRTHTLIRNKNLLQSPGW